MAVFQEILRGTSLTASGPVIGGRMKHLGVRTAGFKAFASLGNERQMNRDFGSGSGEAAYPAAIEYEQTAT